MATREEFIEKARKKYGSRGAKQAKEMIDNMSSSYAGGQLFDEDKEAVEEIMQEIFWLSKKLNKKYTPKKYLKKK